MFSIASSSHKPGWLAILPQGGTLTLAHVVRHADRRAEVVHLEEFAIVGDEASALKRLVSAYRLKSSRCTTLMGDGDYQINTLDAPPVPADERREALRWALRDRIDYPVESACLGWLDIPGNDAAGHACPWRPSTCRNSRNVTSPLCWKTTGAASPCCALMPTAAC